jgi:hypothetical protein
LLIGGTEAKIMMEKIKETTKPLRAMNNTYSILVFPVVFPLAFTNLICPVSPASFNAGPLIYQLPVDASEK